MFDKIKYTFRWLLVIIPFIIASISVMLADGLNPFCTLWIAIWCLNLGKIIDMSENKS